MFIAFYSQNVIYKDRDTRQDHGTFEPQSCCRDTNENIILMK